MRYIFDKFEFDKQSHTLTSEGSAIEIRLNEAKLLAFLIEHADRVISKDEILAHVWQDKVVSEQAIFQNISHLRSLFGRDAIKTFSKRGYQWQINVSKQVTDNSNNLDNLDNDIYAQLPSTPVIRDDIKENSTVPHYFNLVLSIITFLLILLAVTYYFTAPKANVNNTKINISYLQPYKKGHDQFISLKDDKTFNFNTINSITSHDFIASSELKYPQLKNEHPFILAIIPRIFEHNFYIDFILKGPASSWQGSLSGDTKNTTLNKLYRHLAQPFIYQWLVNKQSPSQKQAQLTLAHQHHPQDLLVLKQLIQSYITLNELDKAMALTEKLILLAKKQSNILYSGIGLLSQSTILTRKNLSSLSKEKLNLAMKYFDDIGAYKHQSEAYFAQSWLAHQDNDYSAIKEALLKSAELGHKAGDIQLELDALTYLSIMAHKNNQTDDKYLYLQQAKQKMERYDLPTYHFGVVPFHYAIFAKTPADKEPHFKQVIEYTKLTPDHWMAQSSRQQLVQHLIKQHRLDEATQLVKAATSDNVSNSYIKTILARANNDEASFIEYALHTFELDQLSGRTDLSLDIALLLVNTNNQRINHALYSKFIADNATPYWRKANKEQLLALKL